MGGLYMNNHYLDQPNYLEFRTKVSNFVAKNITPNALGWEKTRTFPHYLLSQMAEAEFIGLSIPQEFGGQGKDIWYEVILLEEFAKAQTFGYVFSALAHTCAILPVLAARAKSKDQKFFLQEALDGKKYLAFAVTESVSGSDIMSQQTSAVDDGDFLVINGSKQYITNGSVAKSFLTLVRTSTRKDIFAFDLVLIDKKTSGVEQKRIDTIGLKTGDLGEIIFNDVRVPKANIIGQPGRGLIDAQQAINRERFYLSIYLNSLSKYVIRDTIVVLKNRYRFSQSLSQFQAIRQKLAELVAGVEAQSHFAYSVGASFSKGLKVDKEIVMCKLNSSELAQKVIKYCINLRGAEGVTQDCWLSHIYADSQVFTLATGTSGVLKKIISNI